MATIKQENGQTRLEYLTKARRWVRRFFNVIKETPQYWHAHDSHAVAHALKAVEEVYIDLGTFGVEGLCEGNGDPCDLSYLNAGDTYELTIVYYRDRFMVTTWGDIVESYA